MKVLHINCNYIGTTLHQKMIEHLDAFGVESQVFVPTYDRKIAAIEVNENVTVSECFRKWDRILFDYKQKKILRAIENTYDVKAFDCIHAYTLFTDGNAARKLSKKYGIPYVVAVRNTDVNDFFRLMVHLRGRGVQIMADAAAIFFQSEAYRNQVFEKYVPEKRKEELLRKTRIIPNGIDDFWFENRKENCPGKDLNGKPIRLIYAGRIDKNKNIPTTQSAMKLLRERGYEVCLRVVGNVADREEFARIRQDTTTQYSKAVPKEELIHLYRDADLFVMPSHYETFGLVYAEAMSQGLPVIYSRGQGFDGQFPEGTVGYAVESSSPESVAQGIQRVMEKYAEISRNCVACVEKFRWDGICKEYRTIYDRAVL